MDDENVLLRNEPAEHVTYEVVSTFLDSVKGAELQEWHRVTLKHLYISPQDKMEVELLVDRGWDTKMELNFEANPDESVDRLTDYAFNRIKQTVRDMCSEELGLSFKDNEKINSLRIRQNVGDYTELGDETYTVEFDTKQYDSVVVTDHRMTGSPHVSGRRLLVGWIWDSYTQNDLSIAEVVDAFDGTITEFEARAAVQFAEESDEFSEGIDVDESEEFKPMDSVVDDALNIESEKEPLDVEDNR